MSTTAEFERVLRDAHLRVTRPRLAVLAAVEAHPHADTDSVLGVVRTSLPGVSHQAVYDVLRALADAGLVRRIQPRGSVARYESRVGDNHHHVVCRSCGTIADVDCAVGDTPCLSAADDRGFAIDEAEVIYWGACPACRAASRSRMVDDASHGTAAAQDLNTPRHEPSKDDETSSSTTSPTGDGPT